MIKSSYVRLFVLSTLSLLSVCAGTAAADDCVALGGTLVSGECRITTVVSRSGSFTLDETLHIMGNGRINVPAAGGGNSLTLDITGDLIIEFPTVATRGRIVGDVTGATAVGATITVNATGDIRLEGSGSNGSRITSTQSSSAACTTGRAGNVFLTAGGSFVAEQNTQINVNAKCPAGEISIDAPDIVVNGQLTSESSAGGSGTRRPAGGPITLDAGCSLFIDTKGVVRSKGSDPGADLVHLEAGCDVTIYGIAASTGQGHVPPTNPPNRCQGAANPTKPANSTACLEIWSGGSITVDSAAPRNGEVQTDISLAGGGFAGASWLDIYAAGDITLVGQSTGPFAVHANGILSKATAGTITIMSAEGTFTSSKRAVQANATNSGGKGGKITVHADVDVTLGDSLIQARGAGSGTGHAGGDIDIQAFNDDLTGAAAAALSATGGSPAEITLVACDALTYAGTSTPASTNSTGGCGNHPDIPVVLPLCTCGELPPAPNIKVEKEGNGTISAGDKASFTITVTNQGPGDATGVTLTDTLPGGLSWQESPDLGACGISGGILSCDIGLLIENETFEVTVEADTTAEACGELKNTATVSADNEAADSSSDNSSTDTVIVVCEPDVKIAKAGNGTIAAGGVATFTVTVTNDGPGAATNVVVTDTLPAGLIWTEDPDTSECSITGNVNLSCTIPSLAEKASFTVIVKATTTTANCGALNNTASVSADNEDQDLLGNNQASATVTVECPLDACPSVPQEDDLVCLDQPLGNEEAECAFFGGGAVLGKDDEENMAVPFDATMNAAVVIVKAGAAQCSPGQNSYRVYTNVNIGDDLEPPGDGNSISHVTYCGCPEEE
jgi:uncharacterized repeat protein (TIGR01451 family)